MKALSKRHKVDYKVYQGDKIELEVFLLSHGFKMSGDDILKGGALGFTKVAEIHERDKTFFNHFVVEDGKLFKMTAQQFVADYFAISDAMGDTLTNRKDDDPLGELSEAMNKVVDVFEKYPKVFSFDGTFSRGPYSNTGHYSLEVEISYKGTKAETSKILGHDKL